MSKKISELPTATSLNSADLVPIVQAGATKSSAISLLVSSLGSVASVAWTNITGKPVTFAPSAHVHPESEVTNLVTDLAAKATTASLTTHTSNLANPHAVTKSQVGLGSVDNTSDLAKPISMAQQTALDAKVAGPTSATNDRVALFSGATGKLIKEAAQTIANLLARANHTGQQTMATISDAGGAATLNVGTTAGTVAAGDDARITGALQDADIGVSAGTVAAGDDSRIVGAAQKSANGSDFTSKPIFRANLDLEAGVDFQAWRAELDKYGLKAASIVSASVIDLGTATGFFVDITGTTTITALGTVVAGTLRFVRFTGALTLTHNATSLILPGAVNKVTAAGDCAIFLSLGSGNWLCSFYETAAGGGGGGTWGSITGTLSAQTDLQAALDAKAATSALTTHTGNVSNPHSVTKTQVGLGSADNTADTAKPVSTAQQTALNLKANTASPSLTGTADIQQAIKFTGIISPTTLAANQNDYAPTGFATATVIRLSASAAVNITGITGGVDGLIKILHNIGTTFTITLTDEGGTSTAANRFALPADVALAPDAVTTIQYDAIASRWRVIGGSGGGSGSADVIQAIAFAASITPTGTRGVANVGTLTGDILINNPSGTPADGTMLSFRLAQDGTGGRTITWGSNYAFGTDVTSAMFPTTPSAKYEAGFRFNTLEGRWRCLALARGF